MYLQDIVDKCNNTASSWNKENAKAASSISNNNSPAAAACTIAIGATAHLRPEPMLKPKVTTLWVNNVHEVLEERHIYYLFRPFPPVISAYQPKDEYGCHCSHWYVTLLSHEADDAIEVIDGTMLLGRRLQVQKARNEMKVPIAVEYKGRSLCRAFRNGYCLEHCPFGLEHKGV